MDYNDLFTVFQTTQAPPIVTDRVKQGIQKYRELMTDAINIPSIMSSSLVPDDWAKSTLEFQEASLNDMNDLDFSSLNNSNRSSTIAQMAVDFARQFVGSKYTWGGTSPRTGFDCSGLGYYSFAQFGIKLPRTAKEMAKVGQEVPIDQIQKGDFIVTKSSGPSGHHVVWVYDRTPDGTIKVIEAKGKKYGVVESTFTNFKNILSVRRITQDGRDLNFTNNSRRTKGSQRFRTPQEFISTLNNAFTRALIKYGRDPRLAKLLTAQNIGETGWRGEYVKGDNNYGNITTNGSDWHISSKQGHHWKDFSSIDDYAEYKVKYLDRKFNFYNFANLNNVSYTMQLLADKGYCPNTPGYGNTVASIYKKISNYV